MKNTPGLSLWHIFLFVVVVTAVIVITGALMERRYLLAGVVLPSVPT